MKGDDIDQLAFAGTVAQVVDRFERWREQTGVTRFYLPLLDVSDIEHVELIAAEVAPQLT
jgi:alkanesulfonate monooxygenase SsuD/methylene tetrahydromethanopterin reductase-like flavin-dependent oxidoreductase (luciferase family)